jgi:dTDP-4-amino-4,6-dideoxygalactose transaminase
MILGEAVKARYFERLAHLPLILPPEAARGDVHSWHLFVIQLAPTAKVTRDELARVLQARNIGISLHYRPLHRMTYWAGFTHARFPAADAYFDRCLTLPLFMDMSEAEVDYVVAALTEILS